MAIEILKYKKMKKILVSLSIVSLLVSCDSKDVEFEDFTYQTVYFPVQNPIRTLVLSDEIRSDNSIDQEKAFTIGASIGGLYENRENRTLKIRLAPELVPNGPTTYMITNTTPADTLAILPDSYYKASSLTDLVIPAGEFTGRIRIDLTDAFFADPKSAKLKYVLPLLITETNKDSILKGKSVVANPIRTTAAHWEPGKLPKDYTLYAINYANKYHGNFFHYGEDIITKNGVPVSTKTYNNPIVEKNVVTIVKTTSLSESTIDRLGGTNIGGKFIMGLKFNDDKTITITSVKGGVVVSGTGRYTDVKDGVSWGGAPHRTLYLTYTFKDDLGNDHSCTETLVYRSSAVVYKEFVLKT